MRVGRHRGRRDDAHRLPVMAGRRVLSFERSSSRPATRPAPPVAAGNAERHHVAEPERLERGQVESSDGAGHVANVFDPSSPNEAASGSSPAPTASSTITRPRRGLFYGANGDSPRVDRPRALHRRHRRPRLRHDVGRGQAEPLEGQKQLEARRALRAGDVVEVLDRLEGGIDVWVQGGWGVDALASRGPTTTSTWPSTSTGSKPSRRCSRRSACATTKRRGQVCRRATSSGTGSGRGRRPPVALRRAGERRAGRRRRPPRPSSAAGLAGRGEIGGRPRPTAPPPPERRFHEGYEPLRAQDEHDWPCWRARRLSRERRRAACSRGCAPRRRPVAVVHVEDIHTACEHLVLSDLWASPCSAIAST